MEKVKITLEPHFFGQNENKVIESGSLKAILYKYKSGICGVRLVNNEGYTEILPFKGQQIWTVHFDGRDLQMKSVFDEPVDASDLLKNFGRFMFHCGALRVGSPTVKDVHPIHGELPNAPFQEAWIECGKDTKGLYISLCGRYVHKEFFGSQYSAEPEIRLYEDSTVLDISMKVKNLSNNPMEMMYLCHINFAPTENSTIKYSAKLTPENVKIRASIPSHLKPDPAYVQLIEELKTKPELHHKITKDLKADPELVFYINYAADKEGKCYTLQVHPDGKSEYVGHIKSQLPKVVRWISRTPDHDAIAIAETGTCDVDGYTMEKEKGNIKILKPGEIFLCSIEAGTLNADKTKEILKKIEKLSV
jgi:hypothetical protein